MSATWTLAILLTATGAEVKQIPGYATHGECLLEKPAQIALALKGVSNESSGGVHVTVNDVAGLEAFCVPPSEVAAPQPPMDCLALCDAVWQAGGIGSTTLANECRPNCQGKLP